jgi:DNA-binding transcriptional LysR family regulator
LPPLLSEFRRFYPDVYPQLLLGNDAIDLIAKDIDVAMRMWVGPMPDSSLTARQIGELPMGVYAAPSYLERNGTPQHPLDLADHDCLLIQHLFERSSIEWALTNGQERIDAIVRPVAVADDLEALYSFLVAGDGVLMTNHLRARHDLIEGRLVRILPDWQGPELVLYAVRPAGRMQPPKVTAFLDFIKPRLDLTAPFPS